MIKFVNAKINLGLDIVKKRADGYHELETLFYPVGLYNGTPCNPEPFCDILEIVENEKEEDEFHFFGNDIDCPLEKNLVWKAVDAFRKEIERYREAEREKHIKLTLYKHIPDGAGLGGGSADASFTLLTLNHLYGSPLNKQKLKAIAASIGADCPFFIENRPMAASGIGEEMTSYPIDLSGYWAVIVKPPVSVSTREAFAGITPASPMHRITDILHQPIEQWEEAGLKNDFEPHIFRLHPGLKEIKERLKKEGALYSSMSGSGSSIFGIFSTREEALRSIPPDPTLSTYLIKL